MKNKWITIILLGLCAAVTTGACNSVEPTAVAQKSDPSSNSETGCHRVGDSCNGTCSALPGRFDGCAKVYDPSGSWDCRCMDNRDCFMTSPDSCNGQAQCSGMGNCCRRVGNSDCGCMTCRE